MQLRSFRTLVVFAFVVALGVGLRMMPVDGVYAGAPQTRPAEKPQKPAEPRKEEDPVPVTERSQVLQPSLGDQLGLDQFGSFFAPQINNRGDVAFIGRYRSQTAPDGFGQAIYVRTAQGEWRFLRHSDRPSNLNETNFVFGPFSFNDRGDLIATAVFGTRPPLHPSTQGTGAGTAAQASTERNVGIFLKRADNFSNVVQLGQEVPNMPSKFSGFSNPSINTKGTIAFVAAYADPDGRGLFISEEGKLRIVARSGQRIAPDAPAVFSEHYYPSRINELGEVAFLSRVGVGAGIFVSRASGVELIAIDGKPSPVKGTNYLGFANRAPSINDKGEVVFSGFYDGPNAGRALFYKGTGPAKLLLTSTDKTLKYKFTDVMNPEINNRGDIVFIGRLEGRAYGIFVKTAKGIEPVAVTGDVAPGLKAGEEFNNFAQQPSINDSGDVVFYAQLKNNNVGIFIKDSKGLRPFVMRGDKLPVSEDAKK